MVQQVFFLFRNPQGPVDVTDFVVGQLDLEDDIGPPGLEELTLGSGPGRGDVALIRQFPEPRKPLADRQHRGLRTHAGLGSDGILGEGEGWIGQGFGLGHPLQRGLVPKRSRANPRVSRERLCDQRGERQVAALACTNGMSTSPL